MTRRQPDGLISVLLNQNAELGDRDDAAMDLGLFDEGEAEQALSVVACDPKTDEDLLDSCAESLAEIWSRRQEVPVDVLVKLPQLGRRIAIATLRAKAPRLAIAAEAAVKGK